MNRLFLLSFLLLAVNNLGAQALRLNLSEAAGRHMIAVSATATGKSYKEKGLLIKLTNKTGSTLRITMDPGAMFQPTDTAYQPLLLAGAELFTLAPWKDYEMEVQTFCTNSDARSPVRGVSYMFSGLADDTLVSVVRYIKTNYLLDGLGQSAVWVFTNGHSLHHVYDPLRERASQQLVTYLAAVSGAPMPDYYKLSKVTDQPGERPYLSKTLKIVAHFEQKLEAAAVLSLAIFDQEGKVIQSVFDNKQFGRGGHRFKVEFEASGVTTGDYFIKLKSGEQMLQEKKVTVD
jgi:hypothetical protein